jgi:hypothetical protein
MIKSLLFSFVIIGATANADDLPSGTLMNENEKSTISVSCIRGNTKNEIECEFNQQSLRLLSEESEKLEETRKLIGQATDKQKAEAISSVTKKCKDRKPLPNGEKLSALSTLEDQDFEAACNCLNEKKKDFSCLEEVAFKTAQRKRKTCRISSNSFSHTMKKVSDDTWMNTPKPVGMCDAVNAVTLQKLEKYGWKFTQTRLSINTKIEMCKALEINKPMIFESGLGDFAVQCEIVQLGW